MIYGTHVFFFLSAASSEATRHSRSHKIHSPLHRRGPCPTGQSLGSWLCEAAQAIFPEFPGGNAALYLLNKFLTKSDEQGSVLENSAWEKVTDDVTEYLEDSLDADTLREIQGKLDGLRVAYKHCVEQTTGQAKTRCLHNVFVDMLQAEGKFKGNTRRTKSLLLKYFDRFTMLFNSVSEEFKKAYEVHPTEGTINIDATFKERQCSFYRYQCLAILVAREYACRYVYVVLYDTTPAPDQQIPGYRFPPQYCSDIVAPSKKHDLLIGNHSQASLPKTVREEKPGELSTRGCPVPVGFRRDYKAKVYDSKSGNYLFTSATVSACNSNQQVAALKEVCRDAAAARSRRLGPCRNAVKANFEEGMEERVNKMRILAGERDCPRRPLCL